MERLVLLGATGSIGSSTIDIINQNIEEFELVGVSCGDNITRLKEILNENKFIKYVTVKNEEDRICLKKEYPSIEFFCKDEGLINLIDVSKPTMVVNALVGFVGFLPSLHTIENDIDLALANKESLVVGGELINKALLSHPKSHLYPIDSEHVAIAKCLQNSDEKEVKRIVITASGGPFRDLDKNDLKNVTLEQALKHPSWSMGKKITIDSATMMNKGFEVIEAYHLFHIGLDRITILIQDESTIHSLVEFNDNSFLADIGPSDMRVPIAHSLYRGKRHSISSRTLDIESLSTLHFRRFDEDKYPCGKFALDALKQGGTMPCVLNGANEEAVYAFLKKKIEFIEISKIVEQVMNQHRIIDNPTKEDLVYVNNWARKIAGNLIEKEK